MSFCNPMTKFVREDAAAAFGLLHNIANAETNTANTTTSVLSAIERDSKKLISLSSSLVELGREVFELYKYVCPSYVRIASDSPRTRFSPGVTKRGSHRVEGDFATCERDHRSNDPTDHAAAKTSGAHVDHDRITVAPHLQAVESERPGQRLRREGSKVPVPQEDRAHLAERVNT